VTSIFNSDRRGFIATTFFMPDLFAPKDPIEAVIENNLSATNETHINSVHNNDDNQAIENSELSARTAFEALKKKHIIHQKK